MTETVTENAWRSRRLALLEQEKRLTRLRDEVTAQRQAMPWHLVGRDYVFSGPEGDCSLRDLFDGRGQLILVHFMFGPDWEDGCRSCSFWADQYDAMVPHLAARNVALAVVSRAPWPKLHDFRERMGWQFNWLSSEGGSFSQDFGASFDGAVGEYNYRRTSVQEDLPGLSVFALDEEERVCQTYSCYSRGLDALNATYQMLDLVPGGRDEGELPYPMAWVRHHDSYE